MIKGSLVALVTPMNEDGSVNFDKLGELIEFHISNNTDGIVVLGTTGESPTLSHEEDEKVAKFAIEKANKRIPIIIGSGSNCTNTAIVQSKKFEAMGADALLVITPYYNKTNNSGMIKHFTEIADNVNIPIIMYNVPSRTGCCISVEAVGVLSKHKNIKGIKEASGNISYVAKIAKYVNDDFALYSGNDDMIIPIMSLGGSGVISVLANVAPKATHNMVYDFINHDTEEALKAQVEYLEFINNLFIETNPIPVKEALNYLGFNVGPCRLPLDNISEGNKAILIASIDSLKVKGLL